MFFCRRAAQLLSVPSFSVNYGWCSRAVYKYSPLEKLHGWLSTTTQNKEKEKEEGMESSAPAFSRVSKRQKKQPNKVFRACKSCRKRKIKCSGSQPCSNCEVYKCACEYEAKKSQAKLPFYNDNNDIIQKIDVLHACVEGLKEATSEGSTGLGELLKLDANLKAFRSQLAITVNSETVGEYEDASAIERQLLNIDSISFTKYDTYHLNRHSQQPVSSRFGLYSPILSLSVRGVSWMINTLLSYADDSSTRESMNLLSRFFDSSTVDFQSSFKMWLSPLDFYLQIYHPGQSFDRNQLIQEIFCSIPVELRLQCGDLPKLDDLHPYRAFRYSVQLLAKHHMMLLERVQDVRNLSHTFEYFTKYEELISILCIEFFQRALFTELHNIDYIESLLSMVKNRYWIEETFTMGKVISTITRLSQDSGLSRWEYYLGCDEETADRRRQLWWDCCRWDSWYSTTTGKQPLIDLDNTACLFPRGVMQLGVDDSMDYDALVFHAKLESSNVKSVVCFGYILLSKIVGKFFSTLLYHRRFTNYRLYSGHQSLDLEGIMAELESRILHFKVVFEKIAEKFAPFFETHLHEDSVFELFIQMAYTRSSCFIAAEGLLFRIETALGNDHKQQLKDCLKQCKEIAFCSSKDALAKTLQMVNVYTLWKSIIPVLAMFVNVSYNLIEDPKNNPVYHLSLLCSVTAQFKQPISNELCTTDRYVKKLHHKVKNGAICFMVITRICLQVYMKSQGVAQSDLVNSMRDINPFCVSTCEGLLDINSSLLKGLFDDRIQSGYYGNLLQYLQDATGAQLKGTDLDSINPGDPSSPMQRLKFPPLPQATTVTGGVDDFLNMTACPELYASFWADVMGFDVTDSLLQQDQHGGGGEV